VYGGRRGGQQQELDHGAGLEGGWRVSLPACWKDLEISLIDSL
jgi:hypothetical protein